jgi:hypothetical protein
MVLKVRIVIEEVHRQFRWASSRTVKSKKGLFPEWNNLENRGSSDVLVGVTCYITSDKKVCGQSRGRESTRSHYRENTMEQLRKSRIIRLTRCESRGRESTRRTNEWRWPALLTHRVAWRRPTRKTDDVNVTYRLSFGSQALIINDVHTWTATTTH